MYIDRKQPNRTQRNSEPHVTAADMAVLLQRGRRLQAHAVNDAIRTAARRLRRWAA